MSPVAGSRRPYTPLWPVNQMRPRLSNVAVLRLAHLRVSGSGQRLTSRVFGSTRTIEFVPPSVTHGAPSGPMITPCGAAPWPRGISSTLPLAGSRRPSLPSRCAVYQTTPSALTATSCGEPPPDGRA